MRHDDCRDRSRSVVVVTRAGVLGELEHVAPGVAEEGEAGADLFDLEGWVDDVDSAFAQSRESVVDAGSGSGEDLEVEAPSTRSRR
jgi:hypothetical protein